MARLYFWRTSRKGDTHERRTESMNIAEVFCHSTLDRDQFFYRVSNWQIRTLQVTQKKRFFHPIWSSQKKKGDGGLDDSLREPKLQ